MSGGGQREEAVATSLCAVGAGSSHAEGGTRSREVAGGFPGCRGVAFLWVPSAAALVGFAFDDGAIVVQARSFSRLQNPSWPGRARGSSAVWRQQLNPPFPQSE